MKVNIKINHVEKGYGEPYIVARFLNCNKGKGLWYYGRYNTHEEAEEVARDFDNAIVMEVAE